MTRPWIYATTDPARNAALIVGEGMADVIRLLVPRTESSYSRSARGWVIPLRYVADVVAYGEAHRLLVVVHNRKDEVA